MTMATPDKKKGKLSRMFGGSRDPQAPSSTNEVQPSSTSNVADSAYASSENETKGRRSDLTPMENTGQYSNVSSDKNLAMNQRTGEVVDQDDGSVVTTTTTVSKETRAMTQDLGVSRCVESRGGICGASTDC